MREGCEKCRFQEENGRFSNFYFEGGYQCRQKNRTNFAQCISYRANDALFFKTVPTFVTAWDRLNSVDTWRIASFFNWTMTYRWDSDIVNPYGYIAPIGNVPLHPSNDLMKQFLLFSRDATYAVFADSILFLIKFRFKFKFEKFEFLNLIQPLNSK